MNRLTLPALLILTTLFFSSCSNKKNEILKEILLTNKSDIKLTDKAISINRDIITNTDSINKFLILTFEGDTIASQLCDTNGDGTWDELFFITDFLAKEKKGLQLKWVDKPLEYEIKTSVRFGKRNNVNQPLKPATEETLLAADMPKKLGFQKYQTDGPTWENDKVGFRHYLDGRNSKDIFGKKNSSITPENVGINSKGEVEDNYHVMEEWGRDIFPVSNSLGLGGYGLLINNEIIRLGVTANDTLSNIEKTTFKITEEGPVKSILDYTYSNWEVSGNKYQVKETTVIWPGIYGYQNTVEMKDLQGNETLLIGLSNINSKNTLLEIETEKWVALILHDSLTYDRQWLMGTAIILPKNSYEGYIEAPETGQLTNSYLAKISIKNNHPITYYGVAGWELSQELKFKDASFFTDYVNNLANQLYTNIDIEIKDVNLNK